MAHFIYRMTFLTTAGQIWRRPFFEKRQVFFNTATVPANFLLPRTQARSSGFAIESHWTDFVTLHQRLTFPWSIARYSLFVRSRVSYQTLKTPVNETELSHCKLQQETMKGTFGQPITVQSHLHKGLTALQSWHWFGVPEPQASNLLP